VLFTPYVFYQGRYGQLVKVWKKNWPQRINQKMKEMFPSQNDFMETLIHDKI
jgi:hypothetical protein